MINEKLKVLKKRKYVHDNEYFYNKKKFVSFLLLVGLMLAIEIN